MASVLLSEDVNSKSRNKVPTNDLEWHDMLNNTKEESILGSRWGEKERPDFTSFIGRKDYNTENKVNNPTKKKKDTNKEFSF